MGRKPFEFSSSQKKFYNQTNKILIFHETFTSNPTLTIIVKNQLKEKTFFKISNHLSLSLLIQHPLSLNFLFLSLLKETSFPYQNSFNFFFSPSKHSKRWLLYLTSNSLITHIFKQFLS